MSKPGVYKIKDHYKGDTFDGVEFTILDGMDNSPINITNSAIKIQFRKSSNTGNLVKEINIGSGITVVNAVGGVFRINSFLLNWDSGIHYYDVQITFPNNVVKTYIKGEILIIQDTTN